MECARTFSFVTETDPASTNGPIKCKHAPSTSSSELETCIDPKMAHLVETIFDPAEPPPEALEELARQCVLYFQSDPVQQLSLSVSSRTYKRHLASLITKHLPANQCPSHVPAERGYTEPLPRNPPKAPSHLKPRHAPFSKHTSRTTTYRALHPQRYITVATRQCT